MLKTRDATSSHRTLEEEVEALAYSPRSVERKEEREEETAIGFLLAGCRAQPAWIIIDRLESRARKGCLSTSSPPRK